MQFHVEWNAPDGRSEMLLAMQRTPEEMRMLLPTLKGMGAYLDGARGVFGEASLVDSLDKISLSYDGVVARGTFAEQVRCIERQVSGLRVVDDIGGGDTAGVREESPPEPTEPFAHDIAAGPGLTAAEQSEVAANDDLPKLRLFTLSGAGRELAEVRKALEEALGRESDPARGTLQLVADLIAQRDNFAARVS